jgi:pantoate--beta-alanine ligase
MKIITAVSDMQALAESLRKEGKRIGFVPTMGFLHEGHLSLMRKAREECDDVIVSIFVNPAQFGPNEDLDRYPRDSEGDRKKCGSAGVDVLFMPEAKEMYPEEPAIYVTVPGRSISSSKLPASTRRTRQQRYQPQIPSGYPRSTITAVSAGGRSSRSRTRGTRRMRYGRN